MRVSVVLVITASLVACNQSEPAKVQNRSELEKARERSAFACAPPMDLAAVERSGKLEIASLEKELAFVRAHITELEKRAASFRAQGDKKSEQETRQDVERTHEHAKYVAGEITRREEKLEAIRRSGTPMLTSDAANGKACRG